MGWFSRVWRRARHAVSSVLSAVAYRVAPRNSICYVVAIIDATGRFPVVTWVDTYSVRPNELASCGIGMIYAELFRVEASTYAEAHDVARARFHANPLFSGLRVLLNDPAATLHEHRQQRELSSRIRIVASGTGALGPWKEPLWPPGVHDSGQRGTQTG